jgi:hypothetical protein
MLADMNRPTQKPTTKVIRGPAQVGPFTVYIIARDARPAENRPPEANPINPLAEKPGLP